MRIKEKINYDADGFLGFLYKNPFGRTILKALTLRAVSNIAGAFLSTPLSKPMIASFINCNNIDMSDFEERKYKSYNDIFTRKIKDGKRDICTEKGAIISPADSRVCAYKIKDGLIIPIKGSQYSVENLLENTAIAKRYDGGTIVVLRLSVDDYHRYCYSVSGEQSKNIFIKGKLHTVQPIALYDRPVFTENCREYTIIKTKDGKEIIQMEVGALMVGKIDNLFSSGFHEKGEEKGRFLFGGSTIVLMFKKNEAIIDKELFDNTSTDYETKVHYGEKIGKLI